MSEKYSIVINDEITCDTVVVGGGVAGSAAAVSAARCGCKTVLVEEGGTLGGQAGVGIVTPMSSTESKSGEPFGGLLSEFLEEIEAYTEKYVCCGEETGSVCPVSPHITKLVLLQKAVESGVQIRFHSTLCGVETDGESIESVIIHDKSGFTRIKAKSFIDATGDADLVYLSGDNYVLGSEKNVYAQLEENDLNRVHESDAKFNSSDEHLMQPVSLFFVMGGVDYETASALNNKNLVFGDLGITRERFEKWKFAGTEGFEITSEKIPLPQGRILMTEGRRSGEAVINMSRIVGINGAESDSLSAGEIRAQLQLIALVDFLKTFVPGFENSYLIETSSRLGVRESRRLVGKYVLSGNELINCVSFKDTICRGLYIIDIHDPTGKHKAIGGDIKGDFFEIPFGSLCSAKFNNLLACGRCVSCDHVAASAVRIQGVCVLTGQAAGTACGIANNNGVSPCHLDADILRETLKDNNVKL